MTWTRVFFVLTVAAWIWALLQSILDGSDKTMQVVTLAIATGLTCTTICLEDMDK